MLFVGGLGDDIFHPPYIHEVLVPAVYKDKALAQWRVAEVSITSSGTAWGVGNVKRYVTNAQLPVPAGRAAGRGGAGEAKRGKGGARREKGRKL